MSRRTMFAPMRPRPTIASCISRSPMPIRCKYQLVARIGAPSSTLPDAPDQRPGRAIPGTCCRRLGRELRQDRLCKHLTELYAPLVEGIDPPDHPLRKHAVLVERHQTTERRRRELIEEEDVGRPIALERAMRYEP